MYINIPWMAEYRGARDEDIPRGSFKFTLANPRSDHTQYNFSPYRGRVYGAVPGSNNPQPSRFSTNDHANFVDGITVVWIASHPEFHVKVIVGWYSNARVWFSRQAALGPFGKARLTADEGSCGFSVEGQYSAATLIKPAERPELPGNVRLGRSPFWYGTPLVNKAVRRLIEGKGIAKAPKKSSKSKKAIGRFLLDTKERKRIELAAMGFVMKRYLAAGYEVEDRSAKNLGYDINAKAKSGELFLEVKGTKGDIVNIELTPNEYKCAKANRDSFRLCVVLGALTKNCSLRIFSPTARCTSWRDEEGNTLETQERVGANISE